MKIASVVVAALIFGCLGASAQDLAELSVLRQQLGAQSEQMQQMQARIEALEKLVARLAGTAVASSPVVAPSPPRPVAQSAAGPRLRVSGFADFTSISRSTNVGTGIATAFGSIPLERSPEARLGEFRSTANHSRLSLQLDTRLAGRDLTAYAETDFLGSAPPNVFAGSNSHIMRLRLYWAQWRSKNWELLGGQSWSLLAANRRGISPHPGEIMNTMVMDPNYVVGLVWTRQATIRVTRHWDRLHLAAAVENPEQMILDPREVPPDVRGLSTPLKAASNPRPDVIVKLAYDSSLAHLEAAAIGRSFQAYSPTLDRKDRAIGGGVSLAGVIHAGPRVDLVSQNFVASGGGRYVTSIVPDLAVRPDGRIVPITMFSSLEGIEAKLSPRLNAFGYFGLVYGKRAVYRTSTGSYLGFGAPNDFTLDNRTASETTVGFRHTFWREERFGALSYAVSYSYLNRKLWGTTDSGSLGRSHMVFTNFRYNLP